MHFIHWCTNILVARNWFIYDKKNHFSVNVAFIFATKTHHGSNFDLNFLYWFQKKSSLLSHFDEIRKILYLKINCLLALICVAFLCACYVSFVTHSSSWTIYAFEETCLTIGYMPSTSFSSAPSTKISTNRFIESCRWIAKIWVDKKLLSNSTILLSSWTWWYSFTTLRSTLIFRNKVWIEF